MSDSAPPTTETTPVAPPAAPAPTEQAQTVESLPQWAQEVITGLRSEAGGNRVKAKQVADEARQAAVNESAAKIAELSTQIETSKTEVEIAKLDSAKLRAVLAAGVPGEHAADVADRVRGNTEEEIKGDAQRLKDLLGAGSSKPGAVDPTQGRGTNDVLPLNGDPLMRALHNKLGIQ